ncbi:bcl-2-modifying factor isoform X1 [Meriones unguiculatus]|uniref:bcl-2-modifying factor isoform X1 n=2 Tax=Meriones unguiculatus TaxID=10047 RepID=UPI000B4F3F99|nr:bcl-2-modifying factor isoform X1 [Meriones unguiculatus]
MPGAGVFWKQYRAVRLGLLPPRQLVPAAAAAPARATASRCSPLEFAPSFPIECGRQAPRVLVTLDPGAEPWHHDSEAETLSWSHPGEMEPPQCVEELEDDVFQPEDGEPGTQPGSLLSADLFAQSPLDCTLSRLQLFPLTHCCGPGLRPISQEDKATQTLSPASPSQGVMLPCGVTEEPQRLFYGNAGYRLPLPASFPAGSPLGEQPPDGQWQHRAEVQIARKLQCIADQFHRLHMQQHQQNQDRAWWQVFLFLQNLALNREENREGVGPW